MIIGRRRLTSADLGKRDTRLRFVWFPVRLVSGQRAWLERVVQTRVVAELPVRGASLPIWVIQWSRWQYFTIAEWAEGSWATHHEAAA